MKHKKIIAGNIAPENRLSLEEKLIDKDIKFSRIQLVQSGKRIGIFCPDLFETFVIKNYCKACPRHLGASGKFYLCKNK